MAITKGIGLAKYGTPVFNELQEQQKMNLIVKSLMFVVAFSSVSVSAKNGPKDIDSIVDVAVAANASDGSKSRPN